MIGPELELYLRRLIREEVVAALAASPTVAPAHVTIAVYAAARSISVSMVRAAVHDGRLPAIRIGRAVRVRADAAIVPVTERRDDATARADRRLGLVTDGRRNG